MGLQFVEVILRVEEHFGIELPLGTEVIKTPRELCELIKTERVKARNNLRAQANQIADERVWLDLRHIIAESLIVPEEKVTEDADFYKDLGAG